ncbi:thermonuclease family protein [Sulfitobacter noctilucicola]|uniref:thermonuclease family protein n=1 Tax=Sulfitobacter noctilucicola TaxID=1342301 RepID=UPI000469EA28|nr:thermonuclease family protein [Sulfitobacter noctilucicola]
MLRICSCFALAFLLAAQVLAADVRGKVRVIDGDTLDVGTTRVRLHGIDAPERDQPCTTLNGQNWGCGDWVTQQVRDLYQGAQARCEPVDRDRYGRVVARCYVGREDIGQRLVSDGLAFAYRKYSYDYDLEEKSAVVADRGIHGFTIQSPARYRLTRIRGRDAPDASCRIKGNISAKGARIYHMPGQKFYERTGIRPEHGERWFCSEAQARASGWRPAKR